MVHLTLMLGCETTRPKKSLEILCYQWPNLGKLSTDKNHQIVIMTARVIGKADLKFLADNGLGYDRIYSRAFGDTTPDDILKNA